MWDTIEGLEIVVPARKNATRAVILIFWLGGWAWGEVTVVRDLLKGSRNAIFELFWLGAWTTGGGLFLFVVLWSLFGREHIVLRGDVLVVRHELLGFARVREYALADVRTLRVAPPSLEELRRFGAFTGIGTGMIAFDYGASTIRFASSVDEPEAARIVDRLKTRHRFEQPGATSRAARHPTHRRSADRERAGEYHQL